MQAPPDLLQHCTRGVHGFIVGHTVYRCPDAPPTLGRDQMMGNSSGGGHPSMATVFTESPLFFFLLLAISCA